MHETLWKSRDAGRGTAAVTAGAAAAGAYVARPGCVQVTNAYGQIATQVLTRDDVASASLWLV